MLKASASLSLYRENLNLINFFDTRFLCFIFPGHGTTVFLEAKPSKRAGHEVPGVVAVLCESLGMGGYREGDMPRMGLSVPFSYHPCTSVQKLKKQNKTFIC